MMRIIKIFFAHPLLILLLRVLLGSIFIVSGLDKIADMNAFVHSILNYQLIGSHLAVVVTTILPWIEILCGVGLILGIYPRASAIIITVLLVIFTILVVSALVRGLDISCGCFTQDSSAAKIGWQKIIENILMIAAGIRLMFVQDWKFAMKSTNRLNSK
ncbi:MAG TPA: MauE/DoxX family redox-associated membrane protein [Bacteroidota bacterium]|nr:MauE/DoxX family redox-associated membrane protein [Bacteroidota bacterium]